VLAYNPSTNTWRTLPPSGLTPRQGAVAVWTGSQLVVWGGLNYDLTSVYDDGARLDPATDTWRRLPVAPVPARGLAGAAWSGREVLLWGGEIGRSMQARSALGAASVGQGAAYDPATNAWTVLPAAPSYPPPATNGPTRSADQRAGGFAVWTGTAVVLVGGLDYVQQGPRSDGIQWTPGG